MVMKCDKMFATFRWWSTKINAEISQQTIQWSDKTHNINMKNHLHSTAIWFMHRFTNILRDPSICLVSHLFLRFLILFLCILIHFDFLTIPHASMSIFILILLTFCIFQSLHFFRSKYWTIEVEINPKQTLFDSIAAIYANIITAEISKHVCLMPLSPLVPSRIPNILSIHLSLNIWLVHWFMAQSLFRWNTIRSIKKSSMRKRVYAMYQYNQ